MRRTVVSWALIVLVEMAAVASQGPSLACAADSSGDLAPLVELPPTESEAPQPLPLVSPGAATMCSYNTTSLGGGQCRQNGQCGCQQQNGACYADAFNDPYWRFFPQDAFIRVRGWVDAGILGNTSNPASHFNGPYNSQEVDNGQFNQAYLIMDRLLASDGSLSIGGRVDLLYGADYYVAQSNGLERQPNGTPRWNSSQYYGLAMPQAYLEAGTNTASVKLGHFYTIVGYESVQSANNFFYSHAYSYQFAGPFTQWGGLANWQPTANWQTQLGIVNGWNTLDGTPNRANFLGSVKYTSDDKRWWSSFAVITGDQQDNPANLSTVNGASTNRTRYSFLFSHLIGSRAEYVFHQWGGLQADGSPNGGTAKWYGLDQYLYFRLNERWRLGTRVEWFRDQSGTRVGLTEPSNPNQAPLPGSYASWSVGANWQPYTNFMLRPELRWDSYAGTRQTVRRRHKDVSVAVGLRCFTAVLTGPALAMFEQAISTARGALPVMARPDRTRRAHHLASRDGSWAIPSRRRANGRQHRRPIRIDRPHILQRLIHRQHVAGKSQCPKQAELSPVVFADRGEVIVVRGGHLLQRRHHFLRTIDQHQHVAESGRLAQSFEVAGKRNLRLFDPILRFFHSRRRRCDLGMRRATSAATVSCMRNISITICSCSACRSRTMARFP